MFHKSEYKIYYDNEDISENPKRFDECVRYGYFVDIITSESTLMLSVSCGDDIVSLKVPGYTSIREIHDVSLFEYVMNFRLF